MEITERIESGHSILILAGRFDFHVGKSFHKTMSKVHAEGTGPVMLNLRQVTFIDSAALGLLALAHKNLKLSHRPLFLVAPQLSVKKILALAKFDQLMPIYATEQEARGTPVSPHSLPL